MFRTINQLSFLQDIQLKPPSYSNLHYLRHRGIQFKNIHFHKTLGETEKFKLAKKFSTLFTCEHCHNSFPREGVVFKDCLDGDRSFKVVSNKYLLKEHE
jgi:hypothetical protein